MSEKLKYVIEALRAAREAKELSQRALGAKVGVPQSHISKIESGAVDLKASSLIEIARALDLELMLVPRALKTTVRGLARVSASPDKSEQGAPSVVPAYRLDDE